MARIILEQDIKDLLLALKKEFRVLAPILKHPDSTFGQFVFSELDEKTVFELSYPVTVLPPKEFLLPARDTLFSFAGNKAKNEDFPKTILFGLSTEDLTGIDRLNEIFQKPISDTVFKEKREKLVVVGVDRFSPPKGVFYDLYLMRIQRGVYAGFAKTQSGQKILKSPFFKEKAVKIPRVEKKADPILANPNLGKIIEKSKDHPIWDELAEKCFGCGICSYVCPLCYCFEVEDLVDFGTHNDPTGKRCRNWDSCMRKGFASITSHDFRPELKDRIYNWYYHKFVRMPNEYNFSGCVDCNRCVVYCPAKINYHQVLGRIVKDSKVKK